ncbi:MAG: hypothetical protein ACJ780_05250 [Solirubrobacteraceae bacterium]
MPLNVSFFRAGMPSMAAIVVLALVGCGGSSGTTTSALSTATSHTTTAASSSPGTSTSKGVNPNQRETLPPGDIPDTIAYVPYTDRALGLTISTPEGWSRVTQHGHLVFTDKLNRVDVFTAPTTTAPTLTTIKQSELPSITHSVKTFHLQSISTVTRHAGPAVRLAYLGDSKPNLVTGKVGTLAFERYDFFHRGREYVVLVSSPKGSDNVDPWRIITNSLRFGR